MASILFMCLLMSCLACFRCERCVSESRFAELEEKFKSENKLLKDKLSALEKKLDVNAKKEKGTEIPMTDVTRAEETMEKSRRNVMSKSIIGYGFTNVAFYAYLSGQRCYSIHETFVFDTVETNVGSSYSSHDGIFDAPVTGVYVFTYTVVPDYYNYIQAEVIVDGVIKGVIIADSEENHDIHPASATVVVHVAAGQHVYIRIGTHSDCSILSSYEHRTTFAGWLLF